jgi:tRNA (mo5U34)-methyltransferase
MSHQSKIDELAPWFHNLHLPDGTQTAPNHQLGDFPAFKWREIAPHIPENLSGWKALDIGCNAGFYSMELAKRGATVTGIDIDQHYLNQAKWACGIFGFQDKIRFEVKQVYDLSRSKEKYDLVWYMGVFYHLRYPFLSLDIISKITGRLMVFQTMTIPEREEYEEKDDMDLSEREIMSKPGWPRMAFIEHSLANDPTNWWAPNHTGVIAMLRASGFRVLSRPAHEIYICEPSGEEIADDDVRMWEFRSAVGFGN